jgi:threonyl-tRNA synthetase
MKKEDLEKQRHSLSHILALSVKEIWPEVKLGIGPAIDNGFYYDFDLPDNKSFTPEDLVLIENKMKEIIKENLEFQKTEIDIDQALEKEKERKEEYKVDLLEELKNEKEKKVSYFKLGSLEDLCRGPHLKSSGLIDPETFKIDKTAGAYWRGHEKNKMLSRIYGLSFATKKELEEYLELMKEAEKRDHRKISKEMDLFSVSDKVGPGLILWHPKLSKTREVLETWWRKIHRENGYDYIYTPHIGKGLLWQESGHLDFFKESMFPPLLDKETNEEYYVKPMSCPFHVEIYKSRKRSYKDLPLKWNELGTCYRYEKSGELHGLARPRGFTQDDAHIICTEDQFKEEYRKVVELTLSVFQCFGFEKFKYYLAVRDPKNKDKYVGSSKVWDIAEKTIKEILEKKKIDYQLEEGGAKFYGPALDIKIFDSINREWQCPTIQLDMNLPSKFGMTYIGPDGKEHTPIMLHRTIFGSLERFVTILIEHYAGAFPFWLAPTQIRILPISDKHKEYSFQLEKELRKQDFRVEVDGSLETTGNKVRKAVQDKIPYVLVIGDREVSSGVLSVRERHLEKTRETTKENFLKEINDKNQVLIPQVD